MNAKTYPFLQHGKDLLLISFGILLYVTGFVCFQLPYHITTGGVAGLNQFTLFLGENATLDTACDHIFHFMELDPEGRHIALGGDLDGCDDLPSGFTGVQDYPLLAQRLLQRGLDEQTVQNIFWNNALRVLGD